MKRNNHSNNDPKIDPLNHKHKGLHGICIVVISTNCMSSNDVCAQDNSVNEMIKTAGECANCNASMAIQSVQHDKYAWNCWLRKKQKLKEKGQEGKR